MGFRGASRQRRLSLRSLSAPLSKRTLSFDGASEGCTGGAPPGMAEAPGCMAEASPGAVARGGPVGMVEGCAGVGGPGPAATGGEQVAPLPQARRLALYRRPQPHLGPALRRDRGCAGTIPTPPALKAFGMRVNK
jgi:hypothetical protein